MITFFIFIMILAGCTIIVNLTEDDTSTQLSSAIILICVIALSMVLGAFFQEPKSIENYLTNPEEYQIDTVYTISQGDTIMTLDVTKINK